MGDFRPAEQLLLQGCIVATVSSVTPRKRDGRSPKTPPCMRRP